jgi:hypothetical protein
MKNTGLLGGDLEFFDAKDGLDMRNVPGGLLHRLHLFEIHEQRWLPHSLRNAVTEIREGLPCQKFVSF